MLIDDDEFWDRILEEHRYKTIVVPVKLNYFLIRDIADSIVCPPDCSDCCETYKRVPVSTRDIERIDEGVGVSLTLHVYEGITCMDIENGCRFLANHRCSIYKYRPDSCMMYPIQEFTENANIHYKIGCKPTVQALRQLYRRILKLNPDFELLEDLRLRVK